MGGIVRGLLAVIAGYATMAVLVIAITVAFKRAAPEWMGADGAPSGGYLATNLLYSLGAAMVGGFVAASIGAGSALVPVYILAALMFALAIVSARQMGARQPRAYQIALALIGPIGAIAGGLLKARG